MNILMVLTSHDQLGDTGKKTGFWLEEFTARNQPKAPASTRIHPHPPERTQTKPGAPHGLPQHQPLHQHGGTDL